MLFIYSQHDSPRIDYVLQFIFEDCLKTPVTLIDHPGEIPENGAFLNYSSYPAEVPSVWIVPHDIVQGFSLESQELGMFEYNGHPVFFGHDEAGAALPYDPMALCFFMLSRYEEYLPFKPDRHGRFPASASAAFRHGFLEHPVVDQAIEDLRLTLQAAFPALALAQPRFQIDLTYDVDAPFAFRGKSPFRNLLGGIADGLTGRGVTRLAYLAGRKPDPYDLFDMLLDDLNRAGVRARFFLLMENRGVQNPMTDLKDARFGEIVSGIRKSHACGLHPSYDCRDVKTLQNEAERYKNVCGEKPDAARFHFIRLSLPNSYQVLIDAGIFADHSMGFPDHPGFRAGTSRTFRFYDLTRELVTHLKIHPFCLMDATFEYYLPKLGEVAVNQKITQISSRVESAGGRLSWIFHNDLLSGYRKRYDWAACHQRLLDSIPAL